MDSLAFFHSKAGEEAKSPLGGKPAGVERYFFALLARYIGNPRLAAEINCSPVSWAAKISNGDDVRCDLPAERVAIIQAMPRADRRIFPCGTDAIGASFTRACKFLGIDDLHFHDLRHEGVSRLFEIGLNIPHVAAVSGHRSWTSLKRYRHLRHTGDKWAGAEWLAAVTAIRTHA